MIVLLFFTVGAMSVKGFTNSVNVDVDGAIECSWWKFSVRWSIVPTGCPWVSEDEEN